MKKFCDKLIVLRREKGLSQEQLAEYLEVSRQQMPRWQHYSCYKKRVQKRGNAPCLLVG